MPPVVLPPSPPRRRPGAAVFLPAVAALAALAVFAAHQVDPQAAAETAFLALLATALLAAVAAVEAAPTTAAASRPGGRETIGAAAALLVVLAAWGLPAGPQRGAVVAALLVGALAVVAGRRLTAATHDAQIGLLPLLLPLALAVQVLVRSDRLLAPELGPRFLVGLLGLPLAAAAATAFLAVRAGRAPALTAAATAALVGPGFTTLTAGALVALAGAEAAWRPRGCGAPGRRERAAGILALAAAVVGVGLVEPWAAAIVAAAALLLGGWTVATGAVVLAAAAGALALPAAGGWSGELALAAATVAPLALVVALAAASRDGRRWALAAVGAGLLAFVVARTGLPLFAAPLAAVPLVAGRSLRDHSADERHAFFAPQVVWSAGLLAAGILAAAYPWLRPRPLEAALGLVGLGASWAGPAAVAMAGAAAALLGGRAAGALFTRRGDDLSGAPGLAAEASADGGALHRARRPSAAASPATAAALAAAALFAALLAALPSARSTVALADPRALDLANPRLEIELDPGIGRGAGAFVVVADTSLSHAVAVPVATPVATVSLIAAAAPLVPPAADWTLTAGSDTAEWSIRRPDVAVLAAHPAPAPWTARVAADGFFGLVFRSRGTLEAPDGTDRLVIERHPGLAPEAVVHVHRLEVRR